MLSDRIEGGQTVLNPAPCLFLGAIGGVLLFWAGYRAGKSPRRRTAPRIAPDALPDVSIPRNGDCLLR